MAQSNEKDQRPVLPIIHSNRGKTGYIGDVRTFEPAASRQEERKRAAGKATKAKAGPAENKSAGGTVDADADAATSA
jgi:hypothetical protein